MRLLLYAYGIEQGLQQLGNFNPLLPDGLQTAIGFRGQRKTHLPPVALAQLAQQQAFPFGLTDNLGSVRRGQPRTLNNSACRYRFVAYAAQHHGFVQRQAIPLLQTGFQRRESQKQLSHHTNTLYFLHFPTLNKQIDVSLFRPLHIGGHAAYGNVVEQFLTLHAHDVHRHLAGNEFHAVLNGLLTQ